MLVHVQSFVALPQLPVVFSHYAQNAFTAPSRDRVLHVAREPDSKFITSARAGGRHRSPYDGSSIDPFAQFNCMMGQCVARGCAYCKVCGGYAVRSDLTAQIEPFRSKLTAVANALPPYVKQSRCMNG